MKRFDFNLICANPPKGYRYLEHDEIVKIGDIWVNRNVVYSSPVPANSGMIDTISKNKLHFFSSNIARKIDASSP